MKIPLYQVDAFTERLFSGNPAAVCPLPGGWLDDAIMQNIAMENNLAETAFYICEQNKYSIRWFTPTTEVDLCGHATLAAAYVIFHHENKGVRAIQFHSKSGILSVTETDEFITLDFPADTLHEVELTEELISPFSSKPREAYRGNTDYMLVFDKERQIQEMQVNLAAISNIKARGVIITARGETCDFVSRFFAPQSGIDEDPVTGSAHTTLTPYWSKVLNKKEMSAMQLSRRRGFLLCRDMGRRIEISGKAKLYMKGEISL